MATPTLPVVNPTNPGSSTPASSPYKTATPTLPVASKPPVTPTSPATSTGVNGVNTVPVETGTGNTSGSGNTLPTNSNPSTTAPFGSSPSGVPYGSQNSNNPNPDSSVYGANGNPQSSSSSSTGVNENGLTASEQSYEDQMNSFATSLANLANGSTPLNAGEEAQVQGLEAQFQQTIAKQNAVNANTAGTTSQRGFQVGAAEYDSTFRSNTINDVLTAGVTEVNNLQTEEASAVATLTESLQNNDIKGIQDAMSAYETANAATADAVSTAVKNTQQAMSDASVQSVIASGITDPSDILTELQSQGHTDVTLAEVNSVISGLSPDAAAIYSEAQTAASNGASSSTVALIMQAPDKATALQIATQAGVANDSILKMQEQYPDAGIVAGDTIEEANAKVQASPSYTTAQKSAALDLVAKQADIQKTFVDIASEKATTAKTEADIANETVDPATATDFFNSLPTVNGTPYITTTQLQGLSTTEKTAYENAAMQAGVPNLSTKDADTVDSITAAQSDLQSFESAIASGTTLPTNWLSQPGQYANVALNKYLTTNNALAAFNTWNASLIPILGALKGTTGGSGGAARLLTTASSWLPTDTDTLAQAQLKISHLNTLLNNGLNSIVPPKNTTFYSGVTLPPDPNAPPQSGSSFNGVSLPN